MTDQEAKETKGLLLIDGAYNTLLIPMGSDEMNELNAKFIRDNLKYVKRNPRKSDLNASIAAYLKKEYVNVERND